MSKLHSLKARGAYISLTRRDLIIGGFGFGGLAVAAFGTPGEAPAVVTSKNRAADAGCVLSPEQTEGPYYLDRHLLRQNITENKPGIPLRLEVTILDGRSCRPLPGAAVDLWHCDASGVYSGYAADHGGPPIFGGRPPQPPPPPPSLSGRMGPRPPLRHGPVDEKTFLRGIQLTDANGVAAFQTIYPGWYMGRTTHMHLKVRTSGTLAHNQYTGGHVCHTGQLFFPDDITEAVTKLPPYRNHEGVPMAQEEDDIFTGQQGSEFIVKLAQVNKRSMADGFVAQAFLAVDPTAEPAEVGFGPPPRMR